MGIFMSSIIARPSSFIVSTVVPIRPGSSPSVARSDGQGRPAGAPLQRLGLARASTALSMLSVVPTGA
jgi:hypothetical protein